MPIYMGKKKADRVFKRLRKKKAAREPWDESDFAQLSLTPLMGGNNDKTRTVYALQRTKNIESS